MAVLIFRKGNAKAARRPAFSGVGMAYELKSSASWTAIIVCAFGVNAAAASDFLITGIDPTLPAVSELNAKFAIGGGAFEDFGAGFVEGSISFPVTTNWFSA